MKLIASIRKQRGLAWQTARRVRQLISSVHIPIQAVKPLVSVCHGLHRASAVVLGKVVSFAYNEPLFRSKCRRVGARFQMDRLPFLSGHGDIVIGKDVRLSGRSDIAFSNQRHLSPLLLVGDRVFIGHGCQLHIAERLEIGDDALIATGAMVYDFDGHPYDPLLRLHKAPIGAENVKPVRIGPNTWIGARAMILKGVEIGEGAIVAAGSVVTRDVAPFTVVAGNPAREIKRISVLRDAFSSPEAPWTMPEITQAS